MLTKTGTSRVIFATHRIEFPGSFTCNSMPLLQLGTKKLPWSCFVSFANTRCCFALEAFCQARLSLLSFHARVAMLAQIGMNLELVYKDSLAHENPLSSRCMYLLWSCRCAVDLCGPTLPHSRLTVGREYSLFRSYSIQGHVLALWLYEKEWICERPGKIFNFCVVARSQLEHIRTY